MALNPYIVNVNGIDHVMQFTEATARKMGLERADAPAPKSKAAPAPANKARQPRNKARAPKKPEAATPPADDEEW